jgi:hypothetical protein
MAASQKKNILQTLTHARRPRLGRDHPVGTSFLDETGVISNDRFFAVGLFTCCEPSVTLRRLQKFRDQKHWYREIKFSGVKWSNYQLYEEVVDIALTPGAGRFFSFVADRDTADPIARFGTAWDAYGKLAEQLVVASLQTDQLITVLADNYSTPDHVLFEEDLRSAVNRRLKRLAVMSVCRLDSRSCDGLQVADLLTSAITHEFRANVGLAASSSPKAKLAEHVRSKLGATSCLTGWRNTDHSVAIYEHGFWTPP